MLQRKWVLSPCRGTSRSMRPAGIPWYFFLGSFLGIFSRPFISDIFLFWVLSPCRGRGRSTRPARILLHFFSRAAFFGHFFSAIFFEQFFQFWVLSPCSGRQKQISEAWSDPLISGALPSSCTAHHGSIAMSCFQLENIIFRLRSRFEFIPPKGNVSAKLAKLSGFSTKHNQNRFPVFACLYFGGKIVF